MPEVDKCQRFDVALRRWTAITSSPESVTKSCAQRQACCCRCSVGHCRAIQRKRSMSIRRRRRSPCEEAGGSWEWPEVEEKEWRHLVGGSSSCSERWNRIYLAYALGIVSLATSFSSLLLFANTAIYLILLLRFLLYSLLVTSFSIGGVVKSGLTPVHGNTMISSYTDLHHALMPCYLDQHLFLKVEMMWKLLMNKSDHVSWCSITVTYFHRGLANAGHSEYFNHLQV